MFKYKASPLQVTREDASENLDIKALGNQLEAKVQKVLQECDKRLSRKGTLFTHAFTLYVVLALCIRRDLNQQATVSWMLSAFRWLTCKLPAWLFSDGALSNA